MCVSNIWAQNVGETAGQLQVRIARATGVEAATVAVAMRSIREAGMITSTGGRGTSAPHMTPMDAARTLIAVMVAEQPGTKAAAIVKAVGSMSCMDNGTTDGPFDLGKLRGLRLPFTLEQAVAALIEVFAFDRHRPEFQAQIWRSAGGVVFLPDVYLEITGQESAELHMGRIEDGARYYFAAPLQSIAEARKTDPRIVASLRRTTSANAPVIDHIAAGFRGGE